MGPSYVQRHPTKIELGKKVVRERYGSILNEKHIIKLATMMLDCNLFVVFVFHDQAKLGSYVVNTHTLRERQTRAFAFSERDRVIKYKINISFVRVFWSLFVFVEALLPLFAHFHLKMCKRRRRSWICCCYSEFFARLMSLWHRS